MAANFTTKTQEALVEAQNLVIRNNQQELQPEHLIVSALLQADGIFEALTAQIGANKNTLSTQLQNIISKFPSVIGGGAEGKVYPSGAFNKLMVLAEDVAKKKQDEYISIEHFLLAFVKDRAFKDREAVKILFQSGLTADKIENTLFKVFAHH